MYCQILIEIPIEYWFKKIALLRRKNNLIMKWLKVFNNKLTLGLTYGNYKIVFTYL